MEGVRCPKCNTELFCGCEVCKDNNVAQGKKVLLYEHDGEIEVCSVCGYKNHCDYWLELEELQKRED